MFGRNYVRSRSCLLQFCSSFCSRNRFGNGSCGPVLGVVVLPAAAPVRADSWRHGEGQPDPRASHRQRRGRQRLGDPLQASSPACDRAPHCRSQTPPARNLSDYRRAAFGRGWQSAA
ncbi:hypothetical protein LV82_00087 [Albidovulum inexpectatum]|uniref:Uncharacterized protein n=1 Tax=Albidovulum inexpectatum TaxID=196587 RepID=A0A2S5JLP4_9RHOB|nr:hypothetical protein LV82_00087 [Albidovulum inexpectatum]